MLFCEEPVRFESELMDPDTGFTSEELEELMSLLEPDSPNSVSEGSDRGIDTVVDERKRRRKISNRESARRSRLRKKRHLENLTNQMSRLSVENRQLKNRLGMVMNQCNVVWRENDRLRSESVALRAKLSDLYWILAAMQSNVNLTNPLYIRPHNALMMIN